MFGPPQCLTTASTCSWLGQSVSGLRHATIRSIQTRFRFGFGTEYLNLATHRNSPARSTKSTTPHPKVLCLLVSIGFQVLFHSPPGVLFTFPSRYYTLSVTRSYLALGDGPPVFPPDSSCPVVLRIPLASPTFRLRDCYSLWSGFPAGFDYVSEYGMGSITPSHIAMLGLGSFPFAHHYLGNRLFSFSSSGY